MHDAESDLFTFKILGLSSTSGIDVRDRSLSPYIWVAQTNSSQQSSASDTRAPKRPWQSFIRVGADGMSA